MAHVTDLQLIHSENIVIHRPRLRLGRVEPPDKLTLQSGDDGIRTHDLCIANAALYQLSYIPA